MGPRGRGYFEDRLAARFVDETAWLIQRAAHDVRRMDARAWLLAASGGLLAAVGVLGYVLGDVPVSVERTLPPLQVITDCVLGWGLTITGIAVTLLATQRRTVQIGYGGAILSYASMSAWFLLGWLAASVSDTRPLASAALYAFVFGVLFWQGRQQGDA